MAKGGFVQWPKDKHLPPCKRSCSCRNDARLGSCRMRSGSARHTCKAPSVTSLWGGVWEWGEHVHKLWEP